MTVVVLTDTDTDSDSDGADKRQNIIWAFTLNTTLKKLSPA